MALREGWDDYVRFAAAHPRFYAVMKGRVLNDAEIPAAEQAFALLIQRIRKVVPPTSEILEHIREGTIRST
ncbi:MAG: TetR family transcriptional regulator [Brevibacillus sp.]|nr:TetR family transcriptional regulator [Brevibacillus sp.]